MEKRLERFAEVLDIGILIGASIAVGAWVFGTPLFYRTDGPVLSIFTAISILIIVGLRFASRNFTYGHLRLILPF